MNIELSKARKRLREFGGLRLVCAYARMGVLGKVAVAFCRCALRGRPLKEAYPYVLLAVRPHLEKRYGAFLKRRLIENGDGLDLPESSRKVWVCWLQGMDKAPEIVHACVNSLKTHIRDREIVLLDSGNIPEYVDVPEHIQKKWLEGRIPCASYAVIVRLCLLLKYGGTWIDATVLCTGDAIPSEYMDSDLFFYQYTHPGSTKFGGISNWFITARPNHPVLRTLLDVICEYWRDFDCLVYYYIFHLFFEMMVKERPEILRKMPYGYSGYCLGLLHHWNETFDPEKWRKATTRSCFHKLNCRVPDAVKTDSSNYYSHILGEYGPSELE